MWIPHERTITVHIVMGRWIRWLGKKCMCFLLCVWVCHCEPTHYQYLALIIGQDSSVICVFFLPFPRYIAGHQARGQSPWVPFSLSWALSTSCHIHSSSDCPTPCCTLPQSGLLKWQHGHGALVSHQQHREHFFFPDQMRFSYMSRKTSISSLCHLIKPKVTSVLNSSLRSYFKWTALPQKPRECKITEVNFSKHFLTYIWGQKCQETYYIIEVKRNPLGVTKSCLSQVTANGKMIYRGAWYLRSPIVRNFICWEGKWGYPDVKENFMLCAARVLGVYTAIGYLWSQVESNLPLETGFPHWSMKIKCQFVRLSETLRVLNLC